MQGCDHYIFLFRKRLSACAVKPRPSGQGYKAQTQIKGIIIPL